MEAGIRRFVVIASDMRTGQSEAAALGIVPVAIITPRSPHGARGCVADEILELGPLTPEQRDLLVVEVLPCLAASGRTRRLTAS